MADKKITDLTAVTTVDPSDVFPLALGGATTGTRKITAADLEAAIGGGGGGGGGLFDAYALLRDQKAAGTPGGTFTSGAWRTRDLNTENDPSGIVSLASNQFTLGPGTYLIHARTPTYQGGNHKVRIYDVTHSATVLVGSSARVATSEVVTDAVVSGLVTVSATTVFELQHRGTSSSTTYGFGVDTNVGEVEVYAEVEIWRFGTIPSVLPGAILGYAYATADAIVSPDPTSMTVVDSLSVTFTLAAATVVKIETQTLKNGGHDEHYGIFDGSSQILPANAPSHGIGSFSLADGGWQMHYTGVVSLAAGSHTITLRHNAASSTSSITWKDRSLVVTKLA